MKFNITQVSTNQTRYWLNLEMNQLYTTGIDIPLCSDKDYVIPSSANLLWGSFGGRFLWMAETPQVSGDYLRIY